MFFYEKIFIIIKILWCLKVLLGGSVRLWCKAEHEKKNIANKSESKLVSKTKCYLSDMADIEWAAMHALLQCAAMQRLGPECDLRRRLMHYAICCGQTAFVASSFTLPAIAGCVLVVISKTNRSSGKGPAWTNPDAITVAPINGAGLITAAG